MLRIIFGDNYMTPIHAATSHGEVIFDVEKNYKERLPEIRKAYLASAPRRLWEKLTEK